MSMKALIAMQEAGLPVNPLVDIKHIMDDLEAHNLIDEKFFKIIRWEAQGCLNNLFKIGA
jgi:hypothetical protein